jgi:hypothetical protein
MVLIHIRKDSLQHAILLNMILQASQKEKGWFCKRSKNEHTNKKTQAEIREISWVIHACSKNPEKELNKV